MNILTLNTGSNSLKFEIVAIEPGDKGFGASLLSGSYDNIGKEGSKFSLLKNKETIEEQPLGVRDHGHAAHLLMDWVSHDRGRHSPVADLSAIERVSHRVVHGADYFEGPVLVTPEVISRIESLRDLAPLHNQSALDAIRACLERADLKAPNIAVFDTVFHRTLPEYAYLYPLPLELAHQHKIRRYGFHGISHRYLAMRYAHISGRPLESMNLITMHLEGGSSIAAIRGGQSVDTSMGFTPLEGLMMGTRSGDIDPALVPYLMRKQNMSADEVNTFLNKKCGLFGVSQRSGDTRELAKHTEEHATKLSLDMFCYRVKKYIGSYLAVLGGAQAIILGGGIGENMPVLREQILADFGWCGAELNVAVNRASVDREAKISSSDSAIELWVIPTQENWMLAKEAVDCPM